MKSYKYKAKEKSTGKMVKGVIQADTEQAAGRLLVEQGFIPQTVTEEGKGLFGDAKDHVTSKDRITFTRQMATLIGAGLPLATSLRTVAEQTQSKAMKTIVEAILGNVAVGETINVTLDANDEIGEVIKVVKQLGYDLSDEQLDAISGGEMGNLWDNFDFDDPCPAAGMFR